MTLAISGASTGRSSRPDKWGATYEAHQNRAHFDYGSIACEQRFGAACKNDIDQYCNQVTAGEGRKLHCLATHEDKIATGCELALYSSAMIISELAMELARAVLYAIEYLAVECEADINEHCAEVMPGEGRVLMCLSNHEAELSESCTAAAIEVFGEE